MIKTITTLLIIFLGNHVLAAASEKLITVTGAEFVLVKDAPQAMGAAYKDPWGLIWGSIPLFEDERGPWQIDYYSASRSCESIQIDGIKGRLPTLDEVQRVGLTMKTPDGTQSESNYVPLYDFRRPALPQIQASFWVTCAAEDDETQIGKCKKAGDSQYSNVGPFYAYYKGAGYFSHRCVVETSGYTKLPLLLKGLRDN